MEVLDRETLVARLEQRQHLPHFIDRRPPRRSLAEPTIDQATEPLLLITSLAPPEAAYRYPQQIRRLITVQPALIETAMNILEPYD